MEISTTKASAKNAKLLGEIDELINAYVKAKGSKPERIALKAQQYKALAKHAESDEIHRKGVLLYINH